jgi:nucleotidyltransferase substrate binding protein (TIGR01987 family)
MKKKETKLVNFDKALQRLKEAIKVFEQSNNNDVIRDGVIQRFEFTYELAWKAAKEYLEYAGIAGRTSPRAVFKEAYAQQLITNEDNWLAMLNDRNMTSHIYKEEMAEEIAQRIVDCYVGEFELLLQELMK